MSKRRARGEGSVRKRSDGRWEGRYTAGRNEETGKLIYKSVLARTQAECKRLLREAIWNREYKTEPQPRPAQEVKEPSMQRMDSQAFTVAQWLQTWYDLYAKQNIRKSTQLQYSYPDASDPTAGCGSVGTRAQFTSEKSVYVPFSNN